MTPDFIPQDLQRLKDVLAGPRKVTLVGHVSPDGDALGSTLAFSEILKSRGHETKVVYPTIYGSSLAAIPGATEAIIGKDNLSEASGAILGAEVLILMDFNEPKRVEDLSDAVLASKAFKILIDHHLDPYPFTDLCFSYTFMSSTSHLLYTLIDALGWKESINTTAAECIYTGMMTDTGNFSYNSENPAIYTTISDLLERGIEKDKIADRILRSYSIDRLRLTSHILNNNLTIYPELKTAIITVSRAEKNQFNYQVGDTEGLVNEALNAKEIEFSIFLHEMAKYTKVSLRSKGEFPVNEFARKFFNGGGHKNASGAEVFDNLQNTLDLVKKAVRLMHP